MRDILQYFDLIVKIIEQCPASSCEMECDQLDHKRGTIDGVIFFADGSRLEFTERVVIENSRPLKRNYRYQFIQSQSPIFRYDNAPHHPELETFPHHKHVGRKTIEAWEPSLAAVLKEASDLLPPARTDSAPAARRRRPSAPSRTSKKRPSG